MLNARTRKTGLASCIGRAAIGLIIAALPFPALAQNWPTTDWEPFCGPDIRGRCSLDDPGVEVFLHQLSEASKRFDAMGFLAPAIDPMGIVRKAYPVNFVEGGLISPTGERVAGLYFHSERRIDLDYAYYFAMGAEPEGGDFAPTHELFHAIQFAYPGSHHLHSLGDAANWVFEGSAEAAELALWDHAVLYMGSPWLDSPLDQFRLRERTGDQRYIAYPFWLHVADTYGGSRPDGFGILHDFFRGLESQAGRGSSIAMVDGALRMIDPEGLYNIYPGFIANYGNDVARYETPIRVSAPSDPFQITYNTQIDGTIDPVSAQAFMVELLGFTEQQGSGRSEVEIWLKTDSPESLHLIVGDTRYDQPGNNRNIYSSAISGRALNDLLLLDSLLVRVVNVADNPATYRQVDYQLIVTVYHEYVVVQGLGWPSDESGPSNEAIDSPIAFSGRVTGQYWGPPSPGSHICRLVFNVSDAQGSQGGLSLLVDGSLAPGEYPVAPLPPDHLRVPFEEEHLRKYPGMAISNFTLALENDGEVSGVAYVGHGGVLTIDTITPRWITGSARVAVEIDQYMGDDFSGAYAGAPRAGPRYAELQMDFSFPNVSDGERWNVASCIGE